MVNRRFADRIGDVYAHTRLRMSLLALFAVTVLSLPCLGRVWNVELCRQPPALRGNPPARPGALRREIIGKMSDRLMTALAAGLALVPIALSAGEPGSEIQAPMALNMVVVPVLYERFGRPAITDRSQEVPA